MRYFSGQFASLSLRTKLFGVNLAVVAGALVVMIAVVAGSEWQNAKQMLLDDTRTQARVLGEAAGAALVFNDSRGAEGVLRSLHLSPHISEGALFDNEGQEVAAYRRSSARVAAPRPPVVPGESIFGESFLDVSQMIQVDKQMVGHILLRADLGVVQTRLNWAAMGTALAALLALGVAFLISRGLGQVVAGPILRLAQVTREISDQSDYSRRATVEGDDEVAILARDFNAMIDQIERRNKVLILELEQRRSSEARLDQLAHFDPLTGLPNRRHFHNRIEAAVTVSAQFGERLSLMFIDLDNFKYVNDSLGHDVGDELLRYVARTLQSSLRANDIICRLGGDEFAVIIEGVVDDHSLAGVASKLVDSLSQPIQLGDYGVHIGCSIGIARCPLDCSSAEALLRAADAAMYDAKAAGKNTFRFFHHRLHERMERRLQLEAALREAILAGEGLYLHYQPVWGVAEQRIVAVEALCRWQHPEAGLVPPDEFIPIAEDSDLILRLGNWVLRTACAQGAQWLASGQNLAVSVNISGRQLHDPGFVDSVCNILETTGFPAQRLEIEFTESVLINGFSEAAKLLDKLHRQGVRIVLDNFGIGYSSLSYLKRLPIDKLKIDRSFVRDLPDDVDDRSIARAIVALARSLNIGIQAEGVEQREQFDYLAGIGCEYIQGYQVAKPRPADELAALLAPAGRDQPRPGLEPSPLPAGVPSSLASLRPT